MKKISDYITKKVADKLAGLCKTSREEYEKYWDDISPFVKYGCLKDDKTLDRVLTDYILFKDLDGKYKTLPDCLEVGKSDPDEKGEAAVDENGEKEEAEVVDEKKDAAKADENTDAGEDEKKEKTIYYVTDLKQQSQYVNMLSRKAWTRWCFPIRSTSPSSTSWR